jgi:hypothetical protein
MKIFKKLTCIALTALSISALSLPVSADWGKTDEGTSYYTLEDGSKATGFTVIDGETYYFKKDGTMLTGSYKIGGAYYRFGSDGKMFTGFAKNKSGDYYYYAKDGKRASGWTEISGSTYYFTGKGIMLKGASYKIDGEVYKFGADGKLSGSKAPASASTASASSGGYFLDGYFGESMEKITKRNPGIISFIEDESFSLAIDMQYQSMKLGSTNAAGINAYMFMEDKYVIGVKLFGGTVDTVPGSILSGDFDTTPFTTAQINAIYNAYVKQYTAKYGDPIDLAALGVTDEDLGDFNKVSMFATGTTIYMVVTADEYVAAVGVDANVLTTSDMDVEEIMTMLLS